MEMTYKAIPGYEDIYEINEQGLVRSLDRTILHKNGKKFIIKGRIRPPQKPKGERYYSVALNKGAQAKMIRIHRLVALTFIPNPYNKPIVNHIDGNPLNNNVSNLEWCTQEENMHHSRYVTNNIKMICLKTIKSLYNEYKYKSLDDFMEILIDNCR